MIIKTRPNNRRRMVNTLAALGDETRFQIVEYLQKNQDICVSELAQKLGISVSAVSQQCKFLELTGLIERQRQGQKICYQLRLADPLVNKTIRFAFAQPKIYQKLRRAR